jgi:hypothetical protein
MQYTFEGDAIAIFGSMASTYGSYAVSIDGAATQYSASSGMQMSFAHANVSCTHPPLRPLLIAPSS